MVLRQKLKLKASPVDALIFTWADLIKTDRVFVNKKIPLERIFNRVHGDEINVEIKAVKSCVLLSSTSVKHIYT